MCSFSLCDQDGEGAVENGVFPKTAPVVLFILPINLAQTEAATPCLRSKVDGYGTGKNTGQLCETDDSVFDCKICNSTVLHH